MPNWNSHQAKVQDAVGVRLVAQNEMAHYEKKLKDEQTKVGEAEETAKILQEEFRVCWHAKLVV
jgi:hypothetical protein